MPPEVELSVRPVSKTQAPASLRPAAFLTTPEIPTVLASVVGARTTAPLARASASAPARPDVAACPLRLSSRIGGTVTPDPAASCIGRAPAADIDPPDHSVRYLPAAHPLNASV